MTVIVKCFDGGLFFFPKIFQSQADDWLQALQQNITFPKQRPIILHGINVPEPRDVRYFASSNVLPIQYAGTGKM